MQGFGVGAAAVGTTISVYAFARLLMNVPAGILGDQHGRKPLLVWGPAITALGKLVVSWGRPKIAVLFGPGKGPFLPLLNCFLHRQL